MTTLKKNEALITFAEMADKYGYQRGSLGVFPHRYEDFPKPVGVESTIKYYPRAEVEEWFANYRSKGRSKLGERNAPRGQYRKRNPILDEIMNQISHDLVLQSKVLIFLEDQKAK
jgi:hypothetical protein